MYRNLALALSIGLCSGTLAQSGGGQGGGTPNYSTPDWNIVVNHNYSHTTQTGNGWMWLTPSTVTTWTPYISLQFQFPGGTMGRTDTTSAVATWRGVGPPPQNASFKVSASAFARWPWNGGGGASSGIDTYSMSATYPDGYGISKSGSRLYQSVNGASTITLPQLSQSASANGSGSGQLGGSTNYSIAPDTRIVRISRPGAVNETVDPNGDTYGHTTRSYRHYNNGFTPISNWQNFIATRSGGWSPTYDLTWNWDPSYSSLFSAATIDWNTVEMPLGAQWYDDGPQQWKDSSGGPANKTVKYTLRDVDGAFGEASYYLTVHDIFENPIVNTTAVHRVDGPLYGSSTTSSAVGETCTSYVEHSVGFTIGVEAADVASKWFCSLLPISLNASFNYTINVGQSISWTSTAVGQTRWLERLSFWNRTMGNATQWSANGASNNVIIYILSPRAPYGSVRLSGVSTSNAGPQI
jgi:hypothetical protein